MVQSSRSGMQNIAEGNKQQSLQGYTKLSGISRGSFKDKNMKEGGFTEQLYKKRLEYRNKKA